MNEINNMDCYKMEKDIIKNFSISGKEESLERMISILKFIAKIREGERINVKTMTISQSDIPSRVYRTFISRETRSETLDFIKNAINKAIDMVYYYLTLEDKNEGNFHHDVAKIIIENLINAKKGMLNLTVTYQDDRKFVTDIESIVETMEIKIQGKNKLLNDRDENEQRIIE